MLLPPMAQRVLANAEGKTSAPRFVFVIQSNGFDAVQACPESIPFQKYEDRDKFESIDLSEHKLPKGLAPLESLKSKTTILQGLSGRCTGGGHSTHGGVSWHVSGFRRQHFAPERHHRLPVGPSQARNIALGGRRHGIGGPRRLAEHVRPGSAQVLVRAGVAHDHFVLDRAELRRWRQQNREAAK